MDAKLEGSRESDFQAKGLILAESPHVHRADFQPESFAGFGRGVWQRFRDSADSWAQASAGDGLSRGAALAYGRARVEKNSC